MHQADQPTWDHGPDSDHREPAPGYGDSDPDRRYDNAAPAHDGYPEGSHPHERYRRPTPPREDRAHAGRPHAELGRDGYAQDGHAPDGYPQDGYDRDDFVLEDFGPQQYASSGHRQDGAGHRAPGDSEFGDGYGGDQVDRNEFHQSEFDHSRPIPDGAGQGAFGQAGASQDSWDRYDEENWHRADLAGAGRESSSRESFSPENSSPDSSGWDATGWDDDNLAGAGDTAQTRSLRPGRTPEEIEASATSGRHRNRRSDRRRWPIPVGLAVVVTVLLLILGVAAAMLPPSIADGRGSSSAAPAGAAGAAGGLADPENGTDDGGGLADPENGTDDGYGVLGRESPPAASPSAEAPAATPTPSASSESAAPTSPTKTRKASPTPSRTQSKSAAAPSGDSREEQVVSIVNQERAANGCGAVRMNSTLANVSRLHSQDQAANNNMSHDGSDGSSPFDRSRRAGYDPAIGENVAAGYRTAAAVMEGWMNSPGHRANILNCDAKAIGVGVAAASDGTLYWTQMFGSVV